MSFSRSILSSLAWLALAVPAGREGIIFSVPAGTTLVRTVESAYALELESVSMSMDGEELPPEEQGELDIRTEHSERHRVNDVIEAMGEGRPSRLRRTFEELSGQESSIFSDEEGDANESSTYESALEGQTVVFTWNDETERFDAAFASEDGGDEALLEGLVEDMDLRRLLPEGPLSEGPLAEGKSWSIEPTAFAFVLDPGGDVALVDPAAEEEDEDYDHAAELRDHLTGEITAVYEGIREEDGVKQAVISLRCDVATHAERPIAPEMLPEGGGGAERMEISFQLEGELRWDLGHGHALSFELSGENGFATSQTIRGEYEGEPLELVQRMVYDGEMTFSMRIERR